MTIESKLEALYRADTTGATDNFSNELSQTTVGRDTGTALANVLLADGERYIRFTGTTDSAGYKGDEALTYRPNGPYAFAVRFSVPSTASISFWRWQGYSNDAADDQRTTWFFNGQQQEFQHRDNTNALNSSGSAGNTPITDDQLYTAYGHYDGTNLFITIGTIGSPASHMTSSANVGALGVSTLNQHFWGGQLRSSWGSFIEADVAWLAFFDQPLDAGEQTDLFSSAYPFVLGPVGPTLNIDSTTPGNNEVDAQLSTADVEGTYWARVYVDGTTGLTHDDVKNGTGGTTVGTLATGTITASPFAMAQITGISPSTDYELFVTQELADTTPQATPSTTGFTTLAGPAIGTVNATAGGSPTDSILPAGASASNITQANGGNAWFSIYQSAATPSHSEIKDGSGAGAAGSPAFQGPFALTGDPASALTSVNFTGLNAETDYNLWVAVENVDTDPAAPASDAFTTQAAPVELRFLVRDQFGQVRPNLTNLQYAIWLAPSDFGTWDPASPAIAFQGNTGTTNANGEFVLDVTGTFNDGVNCLILYWKQDETPDWWGIGIEAASFT